MLLPRIYEEKLIYSVFLKLMKTKSSLSNKPRVLSYVGKPRQYFQSVECFKLIFAGLEYHLVSNLEIFDTNITLYQICIKQISPCIKSIRAILISSEVFLINKIYLLLFCLMLLRFCNIIPANNAMQGPQGPCTGNCAGPKVARHGFNHTGFVAT